MAGQLGQAVGPGAGVRRAVELLPVGGGPEPEVGAAVDDQDVLAERLGHGGGLPVRQRQEDHVVVGQHLRGGGLQDPAGQRRKVRLEQSQRGARVGAAGQRPDLDLRVAEQQAQHLAARVSARAGDGDSQCHGVPPLSRHEYTQYRTFMQGVPASTRAWAGTRRWWTPLSGGRRSTDGAQRLTAFSTTNFGLPATVRQLPNSRRSLTW